MHCRAHATATTLRRFMSADTEPLFFVILTLSFISLFIINIVFWWGITVVFTVLGVFKLKAGGSSKRSMLSYFIFEEFLGLIFLLSFNSLLLTALVIFKGGFAPFHFWLGKVLLSSGGTSFGWILTVQKLPYYVMVLQLWS